MILYIACLENQHLVAVNIFFRKYFDNIGETRFELGILIVPSNDLNLKMLEPISNYIKYLMIDNGAYRGTLVDINSIIETYNATKRYFKNVKVILWDFLENVEETINLHKKALRHLKHFVDTNDIVPVLQGKSLNDYVKCLELIQKKVFGHGIPSPSIYAIGGLKVKKPRQRVEILNSIIPVLRRKRKQVHVLGADMYIIEKFHRMVRSFDTANWTYDVTRLGALPVPNVGRVRLYVNDEYWKRLPWEEKLAIALYFKLLAINSKITP